MGKKGKEFVVALELPVMSDAEAERVVRVIRYTLANLKCRNEQIGFLEAAIDRGFKCSVLNLENLPGPQLIELCTRAACFGVEIAHQK